MITRREILTAATATLAASCTTFPLRRRAPFVRVDGTAFRAGDAPYAIAGTNMWYAAYLGAGRRRSATAIV